MGLLTPEGDEVLPTRVLEMTQARQSFAFEGLSGRPVASILRDFSAPVILSQETDNATRALLMAHDTDPFNKWEAGRAFARDLLCRMVTEGAAPDTAYLDAVAAMLRDAALDPAFRALVLGLPSEDDLAQTLFERGRTPDPTAIHDAVETLTGAMARHMQDDLPHILADMAQTDPDSADAENAGKRSLGNAVLALVSRLDGGEAAAAQFAQADNMTRQLAALACLLTIGTGTDQLETFRDQWQHDRLVMNKWFGLQVARAAPDRAADVAEALTRDPDFTWRNPNRFRAVFGGLAGNAAGFHHPSGTGYRLLGDWLARLDAVNPQTAARMSTAFETWPRYDADRQAQIRAVLERLAARPGLSRDSAEMVQRMLSGSG